MRPDAAALPLTPDFDVWTAPAAMDRAGIEDAVVAVRWNDGRVSRFHYRWLRDGCPCPECLHPDSREQLFDVSLVPAGIQADAVSVDASGALRVDWNDGHVSRYHPGWLHAHDYSSPGPSTAAEPPVTTWDAGFARRIPTFAAHAVLVDDTVLLAWLEALQRFGLTRLTGVAREAGAILEVAARIGVVRDSVFGRVFDVRTEAKPVSNAYTSARLLPHTDLPTRECQPGIQMLHCLVNDAAGGESVMVDGFALAAAMRARHPEAFATLTGTAIEFASRGLDSEYRWTAPMIGIDERGEVRELRPGALLRAPIQVPFEDMERVYDGIQTFVALGNDETLRAVFPIAAGDLLAFDNRRVLHGREAFDPGTGMRHLRGCYLDRDELESRLRVLRRAARASAAEGEVRRS